LIVERFKKLAYMDKIENMNQYQWAVNRVEELLPLVDDNTPTDDPNSVELERLSNMVADYSDEHFAIGTPSLADIIKLRMEEMGISISKLASLIGVTPINVKEYLTGSNEPTLSVGREISRKLGIDANLVLGV